MTTTARHLHGATLALCLLLTPTFARSAPAAKPAPSLRPEPVKFQGTGEWTGPQFLQADKKGNLFLLHFETWSVYPVGPEGKLGEATRLRTVDGRQGSIPFLSAAMSPSGESWIIREGYGARLFRDGVEEPMQPVEWMVETVAFAGEDPLVSVLPDPATGAPVALPAEPALVQRWDGDRWSAVIKAALEDKDATSRSMARMQDRATMLLTGSDGHLWLAYKYKHRILEHTPAGRRLGEITVGDGKVKQARNAAAAEKKFGAEVKRQGHDRENVRSEANTAEQQVYALAEGQDGKLYILARGGDGSGSGNRSLDRYDAVLGTVERLPLKLQMGGQATLASGKDGLYIAAYNSKSGIWRLSWNALEEARWVPVDEAKTSEEPQPEAEAPPRQAGH